VRTRVQTYGSSRKATCSKYSDSELIIRKDGYGVYITRFNMCVEDFALYIQHATWMVAFVPP
jgi:hypothetical protein